MIINVELQIFRLIVNKATLRLYGYFLELTYLIFLRNLFFSKCEKLKGLVKKTQRILGMKDEILKWCRKEENQILHQNDV
jgi:hypothetical protein